MGRGFAHHFLSPFILTMIELITRKDVEHLFIRLEEINERTKKHTKQIKMIEKKIKEQKDE